MTRLLLHCGVSQPWQGRHTVYNFLDVELVQHLLLVMSEFFKIPWNCKQRMKSVTSNTVLDHLTRCK
ncbi:polyprotein [Frankliniella fusca]|uniref:Polyprotein n=1 Tax=Frankliniella fusca TaxID=407009 RepID=A0AAE1LEG6_9NEOP|nr:polyprotein [Frankliniella fusca]KAK3917091.1 polyprotein [Frankliniella fusca]KAK3931976.1 polyprotein [Frankliniella fusca]KAK3931981.1 polyprotein [Frankliniella fusca]